MDKKYEAVLIIRPCSINVKFLSKIPDFIDGDVVLIDLEIPGSEFCAMGVLKAYVAAILEYDYTGLQNFLGKVCNDLTFMGSGEFEYSERGITIHILLTEDPYEPIED